MIERLILKRGINIPLKAKSPLWGLYAFIEAYKINQEKRCKFNEENSCNDLANN